MGPGRQPKAVEVAERVVEGRPEKKTTEGPCRVQNHTQQQVAWQQRQRLFFRVSERRCGPRTAVPLELPKRVSRSAGVILAE